MNELPIPDSFPITRLTNGWRFEDGTAVHIQVEKSQGQQRVACVAQPASHSHFGVTAINNGSTVTRLLQIWH
jgi:hypothetical protein